MGWLQGSGWDPQRDPPVFPPSQNISDTMTVLPKLSTGLDVNVRFTGVSDFEYTPECIVFDLLNIPLYHGWLVDPQVSPPPAREVTPGLGGSAVSSWGSKLRVGVPSWECSRLAGAVPEVV